MAVGAESLSGPRLEFVARALKGTVLRTKYIPPEAEYDNNGKKSKSMDISNTKVEAMEPAGYMVYTPTGQCYRLSNAEFFKRGFDRQPEIIGYEQANDNKTPAGRYKLARNDSARNKAWAELEKQVIDLCIGRNGSVLALIEGYDPNGKMPKDDVEKELAP